MRLTDRERILAALTLLAALYGITGMVARQRIHEWRAARTARTDAAVELARRENLVAQRTRWEDQYEAQRERLPVFEPMRPVVTHWLGIMDRAAMRHDLRILRRQAGEEQQIGEVFELPIECREWEGSLESLIRFLYHLHREEAMMDVRQLLIRVRDPSNPDALSGRFTLFCAFLRKSETMDPVPATPER